jgi:DNA polymerase-4
MPLMALISLLGKASGHHLHALAHGLDPRPVRPGGRRRSIGTQRAMGRGRWSAEDIDAVLLQLVERVCRRMRAAQREGRTVTLRLRFDDFTRCTRSRTLVDRTASTEVILLAGQRLLDGAWPLIQAKWLTLLGISVSGFDGGDGIQLELPFPGHERAELDGAVDAIRDRYGTAAVTRAVLLGRDPGISMPLLPD